MLRQRGNQMQYVHIDDAANTVTREAVAASSGGYTGSVPRPLAPTQAFPHQHSPPVVQEQRAFPQLSSRDNLLAVARKRAQAAEARRATAPREPGSTADDRLAEKENRPTAEERAAARKWALGRVVSARKRTEATRVAAAATATAAAAAAAVECQAPAPAHALVACAQKAEDVRTASPVAKPELWATTAELPGEVTRSPEEDEASVSGEDLAVLHSFYRWRRHCWRAWRTQLHRQRADVRMQRVAQLQALRVWRVAAPRVLRAVQQQLLSIEHQRRHSLSRALRRWRASPRAPPRRPMDLGGLRREIQRLSLRPKTRT